MRVLLISKALVVGAYQTKLELLARAPDVQLTAVVPPSWRDERGALLLERSHLQGYDLQVLPLRWNGNFHLYYYPSLPALLSELKPDLIHIDEEPYNLATAHILFAAHRRAPRARMLFFTWQNLLRRYPPPFSWLEQFVYRGVSGAIAGNGAAVEVLRKKGFTRPIALVPQFGVNEAVLNVSAPRAAGDFVIGYAGRLVPEKGVDILLRALARLSGDWHARIVGSGPDRASLESLAAQYGIARRVRFEPPLPSARMAEFYQHIDVLVLPSISRPNWIEQFGRVLAEAMACEVPVVGSTCGEIPCVIGEGGLIFPEGDATALSARLAELQAQPTLRAELGRRGRERVLAHFTQQRIVDATLTFYRELLQQQ